MSTPRIANPLRIALGLCEAAKRHFTLSGVAVDPLSSDQLHLPVNTLKPRIDCGQALAALPGCGSQFSDCMLAKVKMRIDGRLPCLRKHVVLPYRNRWQYDVGSRNLCSRCMFRENGAGMTVSTAKLDATNVSEEEMPDECQCNRRWFDEGGVFGPQQVMLGAQDLGSAAREAKDMLSTLQIRLLATADCGSLLVNLGFWFFVPDRLRDVLRLFSKRSCVDSTMTPASGDAGTANPTISAALSNVQKARRYTGEMSESANLHELLLEHHESLRAFNAPETTSGSAQSQRNSKLEAIHVCAALTRRFGIHLVAHDSRLEKTKAG